MYLSMVQIKLITAAVALKYFKMSHTEALLSFIMLNTGSVVSAKEKH